MTRKPTRRRFLKGAAVTAAVGAVAAPSVVRAEPMVLKMQAAWGGGIFLENPAPLRLSEFPIFRFRKENHR